MNKFANSFLPLNPAKTTAIGHRVMSGSCDVNVTFWLATTTCRLAQIRFIAEKNRSKTDRLDPRLDRLNSIAQQTVDEKQLKANYLFVYSNLMLLEVSQDNIICKDTWENIKIPCSLEMICSWIFEGRPKMSQTATGKEKPLFGRRA